MGNSNNNDPQFNFKGITMGNPWVSPKIQYTAYLDFLFVNN